MKLIFGIILILAGIALGIYLGLFVLFIGGIVQIVEQANLDIADGGIIAWGVVKIMCATVVGSISAFALIIPGFSLIATR